MKTRECKLCNGAGETDGLRCPPCEGSGWIKLEGESTYEERLRDELVTAALGGLIAHKGPRTTPNEMADCIESAETMIAMLQARKQGGEV